MPDPKRCQREAFIKIALQALCEESRDRGERMTCWSDERAQTDVFVVSEPWRSKLRAWLDANPDDKGAL